MDYNVEFIDISELKPYKNNAKIHNDEQIDMIIKSIEQFGFRQNLVIDKDNVIIIGHGRFAAAKKMGLDVVPCVRITDLTEEQVKALRIADNKIADRGFWDRDILTQELKDIAEKIKMEDFGFEPFELDFDNYIDNFFEEGTLERKKNDENNVTVIVKVEKENIENLKQLLSGNGYSYTIKE